MDQGHAAAQSRVELDQATQKILFLWSFFDPEGEQWWYFVGVGRWWLAAGPIQPIAGVAPFGFVPDLICGPAYERGR